MEIESGTTSLEGNLATGRTILNRQTLNSALLLPGIYFEAITGQFHKDICARIFRENNLTSTIEN